MVYIGERYEILEEIGRCSNSCLYKGIDSYDKQLVIINIIDKGVIRSKKFISNLIDESTSINEIDSPNILKIRDVGMDKLENGNELYYVVSEYMEGSTLKQLTKYHKLNMGEIIIIFRQILNALEVIHSYDVYHGCLQPSNIIIDEGYTVKLSNIGIIKSNNKIFKNGIKRFSKNLKYMCPHQICLGYTDKSSDFHALGVIMFELIFGENPFENLDNEEDIIKRMDKGINWKDINTQNIPDKILNIVKKLLSRKHRYETPQEIMIDLSEYLYEVENICEENLDIHNNEEKTDNKHIHRCGKFAVLGVIAVMSFLFIGMTIK
ncbi:serine/threonine-protein kinase [Paraclostridium ghonii]|uniref:serine/threonine-protein kinase n=1 Tax=Paraclostridium ghonii TaxID=29358 RepID=UPI00202D07D0|nr:serine/threonine-protein kinase [Paeniclostridium ghonii]MCM0168135.1 serine/threonine protein kinase [Paeniclostridium ghonii]